MKKKGIEKKIPLTTASIKVGGILKGKDRILLFSKIVNEDATRLVSNVSTNGLTFSKRETRVRIFAVKKRKKVEIDPATLVSLSFFSSPIHNPVMTVEILSAPGVILWLKASTKNMKDWIVEDNLPSSLAPSFGKKVISIPKEKNTSSQAVYYAEKGIWARIARKKNEWSYGRVMASPRLDRFDSESLNLIAAIPLSVLSRHHFSTDSLAHHHTAGLFLLYQSQTFEEKVINVSVGGLFCFLHEKDRVVWRSEKPLWHGQFQKKTPLNSFLMPLGAEPMKNDLMLYWIDSQNEVIAVKVEQAYSEPFEIEKKIAEPGPLSRSIRNPIIEPRYDQLWEADGTFNPAAFQDEEGNVHMLYRAIGHDGISRIGYAYSQDGIHFNKRSSHPVYEPKPGYGMPNPQHASGPTRYDPLYYTSGGGWGGSEDPRTVKIGNTIYMMYVAFEGWGSIRIALTSINMNDLIKDDWKWKKPVLISPPGEISKNWLLFPEKIHGKYAIVHSIVPKILIEYIDDLNDFDGKKYIHSPRGQGPQIGRMGYWDNIIRGAGPPPLKIAAGWLLLYHAMDRRDPNKYKLGAMILDRKDPTKILYRSNNPLLSPDMYYENNGKPGVIYASGAVIKGKNIYIYYGGGDKIVAVATSPLSDFLEYIKVGKQPNFVFSRINV